MDGKNNVGAGGGNIVNQVPYTASDTRSVRLENLISAAEGQRHKMCVLQPKVEAHDILEIHKINNSEADICRNKILKITVSIHTKGEHWIVQRGVVEKQHLAVWIVKMRADHEKRIRK